MVSGTKHIINIQYALAVLSMNFLTTRKLNLITAGVRLGTHKAYCWINLAGNLFPIFFVASEKIMG